MKLIVYIFLILFSGFTFAIETPIKWIRSPLLPLSERVAGHKIKKFEVQAAFTANEKGEIVNAKIIKSSGRPQFDTYILAGLYLAKTQIYYENGKPTPFNAIQAFEINNKYANDKTYYLCRFETKSKHYEFQQQYTNFTEALKELDYVYLNAPVSKREFELSKYVDENLGEFEIEFYSQDGKISNVRGINSKDYFGLYAGEAVEYAKTIQPKKANWSKNRHKFTDTITLSRKCNSKPI